MGNPLTRAATDVILRFVYDFPTHPKEHKDERSVMQGLVNSSLFVSRVKVVVKSESEKHMSLNKNQPGFNERVALQKELELYETIF
jgi:hypothetical protein